MVKDALEQEAQEKRADKMKRMDIRKDEIMKRDMAMQLLGQAEQAEFNIEDKLNKPSKTMDKYERVFNNNTEFFSTYNPDMIEETLVNYLKNENFDVKAKEDKYKIKYTLRGTDDFENNV